MRRMIATVAVCIISTGLLGCRERLARSIDCGKVVRLQLGQTAVEVEALLGPPAFAVGQGGLMGDGSTWTPDDTVWFYSTRRDRAFPYGRDEFTLEFGDGRLVEASAYRIWRDIEPFEGAVRAFWLGQRSDGPGRQSPKREFGPAFESVFTCAPGFSRQESVGRD